jgi:hypothetical protein
VKLAQAVAAMAASEDNHDYVAQWDRVSAAEMVAPNAEYRPIRVHRYGRLCLNSSVNTDLQLLSQFCYLNPKATNIVLIY